MHWTLTRNGRKYNFSATVITLLFSSALFRHAQHSSLTPAKLTFMHNIEITTKMLDDDLLGRAYGILSGEQNVHWIRRFSSHAVLTTDAI
jgi:hypothetical protein